MTWGGEGARGQVRSERQFSFQYSPSTRPWPRTCIPVYRPGCGLPTSSSRLCPLKPQPRTAVSVGLKPQGRSPTLFAVTDYSKWTLRSILSALICYFSSLIQTFCFLINCHFFHITLSLFYHFCCYKCKLFPLYLSNWTLLINIKAIYFVTNLLKSHNSSYIFPIVSIGFLGQAIVSPANNDSLPSLPRICPDLLYRGTLSGSPA